MNIRTFVTILSQKAQYNFPKMREVKGRLVLFRKFIRFGNVLRPLIIGVGARECLEEERECLETRIGREEKAVECLGEEGGCLDTGKGRECWEGAEAGLAAGTTRPWVTR